MFRACVADGKHAFVTFQVRVEVGAARALITVSNGSSTASSVAFSTGGFTAVPGTEKTRGSGIDFDDAGDPATFVGPVGKVDPAARGPRTRLVGLCATASASSGPGLAAIILYWAGCGRNCNRPVRLERGNQHITPVA